MPPRREDDVRIAMDAIRRIVQALRESSRAAEKHVGVSGARLFVLQQLVDGPATIGELAERTATHQSSVSVVVQRLVEQRLVRRGVDAQDRRRRVVSLTATGRARLERRPALAQERLVARLAALPPGERRRIASALAKVAVAIRGRATRAPAPMFFEDTPPRRR